MSTHDVKIEEAQDDPKSTSAYHMDHDSTPRGVVHDFMILGTPKHVEPRPTEFNLL